MMSLTECLDVIKSHASVRSYTGGVDEDDLEAIVNAARRAPTGWNLQPLTVIVVVDRELKSRLAEALGGQEHVANAPVFLVFVVDYSKIVGAGERLGVEVRPGLGNLVEALIDAGIASGWAAVAAESLGYGVTFIALYENPCGVAEALGLPGYVVPAVGLTIGKPAEKPEPRPRQRLDMFRDFNAYSSEKDRASAVLEVYGARAGRLFRYLFTRNGYYERASRNMLKCLCRAGFEIEGCGSGDGRRG